MQDWCKCSRMVHISAPFFRIFAILITGLMKRRSPYFSHDKQRKSSPPFILPPLLFLEWVLHIYGLFQSPQILESRMMWTASITTCIQELSECLPTSCKDLQRTLHFFSHWPYIIYPCYTHYQNVLERGLPLQRYLWSPLDLYFAVSNNLYMKSLTEFGRALKKVIADLFKKRFQFCSCYTVQDVARTFRRSLDTYCAVKAWG